MLQANVYPTYKRNSELAFVEKKLHAYLVEQQLEYPTTQAQVDALKKRIAVDKVDSLKRAQSVKQQTGDLKLFGRQQFLDLVYDGLGQFVIERTKFHLLAKV